MSIHQSKNKRWRFACILRFRRERSSSLFFLKTFVSGVSDNAIFLGFSWIPRVLTEERYSRKKRKETKEKRKGRREKRQSGSMWKDANNGTHDLRCVPEEHTDFTCFSPILLHHCLYRGHAEISYENTSRREDSVACKRKCSKADVNSAWFATGIWNATDAIDGRPSRT